MFSSLLRPKKRPRRRPLPRTQSYFDALPQQRRPQQYNHRSGGRRLDVDDDGIDDDLDHTSGEDNAEDDVSEEDGDDPKEDTPLLPIFSAAHLARNIRQLIADRCETTLSWDQLRSPQVSQFLVKPIQQQIRSAHFSRATLYALLANCLQFAKEGEVNAGNMGVCKTRALVAELLAIRLLREYTTRELIDALSYDFDPMQGVSPVTPNRESELHKTHNHPSAARSNAVRTSTLEVAIRAQAKRFLAHPLCVQHLEAIWAGAIVFHSAADSLHRYPSKPPLNTARHYGATHSPDAAQPSTSPRTAAEMVRRAVTLYNPNDASLFKLSRLRVPKYRSLFSTLSFATMLGLFLAVLIERSLEITALEIVFWFWSASFMLDEIVGFSEQGFSLYIINVWNSFDIGILLLFFTYYVLRLYGIVFAHDDPKHIANLAYDVLASTAVLLFPRLFSLLDHYRYFSQLLIAFRMMAQDLAAILVLIAITCSGFFVAFTTSFTSDRNDGGKVAFSLFQILMGFTPAAWDVWPEYNILGKAILTLFLIIGHFLIVTILITVLTNSFMAIVKNANEEHQYLFAVNVLSMVKSDALFSYVAPSNLLGWIISPLRFLIPFRHFVRVNRTVIKVTHFPVLFAIFAYERLRLAKYANEPSNLIDARGRRPGRLPTFGGLNDGAFAATARVREPSVTTRYKDRALEEVFLRPLNETSSRKPSTSRNRQASAVDNWINTMGDVTSPPAEDARSVLERLEVSRALLRRSATSTALSRHSVSRSLEPLGRRPPVRAEDSASTHRFASMRETDAEGDDELGAQDDDEENDVSLLQSKSTSSGLPHDTPRLQTPRQATPRPATLPRPRPIHLHDRHASINTIIHVPTSRSQSASSRSSRDAPEPPRTAESARFGTQLAARRTPRPPQFARRPGMPDRDEFQSAPNLARFAEMANRSKHRIPSFDALALDLASDIGDNRPAFGADNADQLLSSSFHTSLGVDARRRQSQRDRSRDRDRDRADESSRLSRIVLTRMNTLEEGFKDILKEVKDWRNASSRGGSHGGSDYGYTRSASPGTGPGLSVGQRRLARKMEKASQRDADLASGPKPAFNAGGAAALRPVPGYAVPLASSAPDMPSPLRAEAGEARGAEPVVRPPSAASDDR